MGKGKDKDKGGRGGPRGGSKQFSSPEEIQSVGRQIGGRGMPPDDEEEDEEEEDEPQVTKQNPNAGMMPPSDEDEDEDDEDEDEDDEDDEDDEEVDKIKLKKIFISVGVPSEIRKELAMQLLRWKSGKDAKEPKKMEYASQPARKQDEVFEVDPKVAAAEKARLDLVKKRREEAAKKRIAADGFDRMKPLSADNHPPGTKWPPDGSAATDIS